MATKLDSRSKAQNILKCSINKHLRKGYYVDEIVSSSQPSPVTSVKLGTNQQSDTLKRISEENVQDNLIDSWRDGIGSILATVYSAEGRKGELLTYLSEIDKEITDIQHYIELSDRLNAYQGWLAYKMLRQRLRQRRKIKDELMILTQLGESKVSVEEINQIIKSIEGLSTRRYEPRVLKELFQ